LTYITEGAGYGNAGVSGDCFTFNFAVSDQYKELYINVNEREHEDIKYQAFVQTGSRRVALHVYEAYDTKLSFSSVLKHASRRIVLISYESDVAFDYLVSLLTGSRREAIEIFPIEGDPYLEPSTVGEPSTLNATNKQGLEYFIHSAIISSASKRKAIIQVYSYKPVNLNMTYSASLSGGSRNDTA
jgi:hypothetical protein